MIKSFYERLLRIFQSSGRVFYSYYDEKYVYPEAYGNMSKLNHYLHRHRQKKIVLYGEKSFPVYCAIYSIVLSGNTWIPITPGIPRGRLLAMLKVLMPDVILFESDIPKEMQLFAEENKIKLLKLEDALRDGKETEFSILDFDASEMAYIMFTSGSTGIPKGVPMTHQNYVNFIENALGILPFDKAEVFSDYHDFAFDISIFYLFCAPLLEGALSPIRRKEERMFPLNHMQKNKITVWSSVPSVISCLQRFRPDERLENDIKIMFLCGEPFSLGILRYCYENLGIKNVYNFYGLTETGVENFYHACSVQDLKQYEEKGFVPIGRPLKGNDIKITKGKELLLSGCQVTPGYLGNVGQERFEEIDGMRWYHTGDIVEQYEDVYFCKGRMDSQVKVGGHRIELMDIEVHVRQYPDVKETVCFVDESGTAPFLVCAVETANNRELNLSKLGKWLKDKLPGYMLPKRYFRVEQIPTNNNGKIDRKAIKNLYFEKFKIQKRELVEGG